MVLNLNWIDAFYYSCQVDTRNCPYSCGKNPAVMENCDSELNKKCPVEDLQAVHSRYTQQSSDA